MVSHDEAVELILRLPEVTEATSYGNRCWKVNGTVFVWDRPFRKADMVRFGDAPVPSGPILGVKVDGLEEKDAVLATGTPGLFTIPHFDDYAAILVQLERVSSTDLHGALVDGWLACAPRPLADAYLREHPLERER
jgi:hypothetical protein